MGNKNLIGLSLGDSGNTYYHRPYVICETAGNASIKIVNWEGFTWVEGATIMVKFTFANTANEPYLQVNDRVAPMVWNDTMIRENNGSWKSGAVIEFMYDGNVWRAMGIDNDTKVTSADNHYTPIENTSSKLTASYANQVGADVDITDDGSGYHSENVISGIKLDSKGHVVGIESKHLYADVGYVKQWDATWGDNTVGKIALLLRSKDINNTYINDADTGNVCGEEATSYANALTYNPTDYGLSISGGNNTKGYVTAIEGFYQQSDARLKTFGEDIVIDFDALKSIPKKYFVWNEDDSENIHIGTSAQEVQKYYPMLVNEQDGVLSVSYDKLSVIALAAVDKLYNENIELQNKLTALESRLDAIENKLG